MSIIVLRTTFTQCATPASLLLPIRYWILTTYLVQHVYATTVWQFGSPDPPVFPSYTIPIPSCVFLIVLHTVCTAPQMALEPAVQSLGPICGIV